MLIVSALLAKLVQKKKYCEVPRRTTLIFRLCESSASSQFLLLGHRLFRVVLDYFIDIVFIQGEFLERSHGTEH